MRHVKHILWSCIVDHKVKCLPLRNIPLCNHSWMASIAFTIIRTLAHIIPCFPQICACAAHIKSLLRVLLYQTMPSWMWDHAFHAGFYRCFCLLLCQIVGNLLYYRYMNPAIVAPDGFDIIDVSAGGQLHSDQRRNLGSVAKMLQHAAANKLFEGENAHMTPMNDYISQTYQKFRWESPKIHKRIHSIPLHQYNNQITGDN